MLTGQHGVGLRGENVMLLIIPSVNCGLSKTFANVNAVSVSLSNFLSGHDREREGPRGIGGRCSLHFPRRVPGRRFGARASAVDAIDGTDESLVKVVEFPEEFDRLV